MKDVLIPTTSEITYCEIASDDYGDIERIYTDMELRNKRMVLRDIVRLLHHTWIGGAIAETRVVYKRSIPKS